MESSPHDVVCFGEVLWDILPSGPLPGGAPMNVAYHLKKCGLHPAIISKVGNDQYGNGLVNILKECGVSTGYIEIDEHQPTGLVYAQTNDQNEVTYDIVQPSAWDFIDYKDEYADLVYHTGYFVFGSLASRNTISAQTLEKLLEAAGIKVCDINLRSPYFNQQKIENLLRKSDILKMNSSELELIAGWFGNLKTAEEKILLLQERFHIDTVIVTKGDQGALVNYGGIVYHHRGFRVNLADTIGSGDAFLAGFLAHSLQGSSVEAALEFACGMGAFVASKKGACPAYERSEVMELVTAGKRGSIQI